MLTVRGLVGELGLELAAGSEGADAPVRWVHISELPDPTPWLSGGELLLTTGFQLDTPERRRQFLKRLSASHLAGLGFGTGFNHPTVPPDLVEQANELGFPVFEVPYELPFIALTERAFTTLVNEQYDVLQRGIAIHKRLERLVLEEKGLDEVVRALAAATGGAVCVLSARAETIASAEFRRPLPAAAVEQVREEVRRRGEEDGPDEFAPDHPDIAGRSLVLPVSTRGHGSPQAWLLAALDAGGLGDFERLILQQAVTVVALELMRQRAMRDTERRLAGDVLAEALTGRLSQEELRMRLRPFGVGASAAVLIFSSDDEDAEPRAAELDRFLAEAGVPGLVAPRERLLCAVIDGRDGLDPVALAERACDALDGGSGKLRAAASRLAPVGALRNSFHEARCALEAAATGQRPRPARGLLPRPGRVPAAPVAPGRRGAPALLRQRARAARGRKRRIRRRADPLARGLHRAERPMGEARPASSTATGIPCATGYGGSSSSQGRDLSKAQRPHRVLAGAEGARARKSMRRDRETR